VAELEERVARVEAQRREEVAELQRVQEAFANTQLELMDATRKLRVAEDRLHELEGDGATGRRSPESAYPSLAVEEEGSWTSISTSQARPESTFGEPRPRREAALTEPAAGSESPPEEPEPEEEPQVSEEGLSLRERLARAAAARHRTVQPPD
jgi:hypothetical protein